MGDLWRSLLASAGEALPLSFWPTTFQWGQPKQLRWKLGVLPLPDSNGFGALTTHLWYWSWTPWRLIMNYFERRQHCPSFPLWLNFCIWVWFLWKTYWKGCNRITGGGFGDICVMRLQAVIPRVRFHVYLYFIWESILFSISYGNISMHYAYLNYEMNMRKLNYNW